jgi:hypothetical protein
MVKQKIKIEKNFIWMNLMFTYKNSIQIVSHFLNYVGNYYDQ